MITIKPANDEETKWIYETAFNDEEISKIFEGRLDRIAASFVCFIIYLKNKRIGFINIVDENVPGYAFVDSGILKKYRGNGYGTESLNKLLEITKSWQRVLISETKKENISAIKSSMHKGEIIDETDEEIFFVLEYEKFLKLSGLEQNVILNYIDSKKIR